eukprot:UN06006
MEFGLSNSFSFMSRHRHCLQTWFFNDRILSFANFACGIFKLTSSFTKVTVILMLRDRTANAEGMKRRLRKFKNS